MNCEWNEPYPYSAQEARERNELDIWRQSFRTNCACAEAIEQAIRQDFDGLYLKEGCARGIIDRYGYKRVAFVLANTLRSHDYDGRYSPDNKAWSKTIFLPPDGDHRYTFLVKSHPAVLDGFVHQYRRELRQEQQSAPEMTM